MCDWTIDFHVYDPQHQHFIRVRANNDGPHGIIGLTVDYVFEKDYHLAGYNRKHIALNINHNRHV